MQQKQEIRIKKHVIKPKSQVNYIIKIRERERKKIELLI